MIELQVKNFRGHNNGLFLFDTLEAIDFIFEFKSLGINPKEIKPLLMNGENYENNHCIIRNVVRSDIKRIGIINKGKLVWQNNQN